MFLLTLKFLDIFCTTKLSAFDYLRVIMFDRKLDTVAGIV